MNFRFRLVRMPQQASTKVPLSEGGVAIRVEGGGHKSTRIYLDDVDESYEGERSFATLTGDAKPQLVVANFNRFSVEFGSTTPTEDLVLRVFKSGNFGVVETDDAPYDLRSNQHGFTISQALGAGASLALWSNTRFKTGPVGQAASGNGEKSYLDVCGFLSGCIQGTQPFTITAYTQGFLAGSAQPYATKVATLVGAVYYAFLDHGWTVPGVTNQVERLVFPIGGISLSMQNTGAGAGNFEGTGGVVSR